MKHQTKVIVKRVIAFVVAAALLWTDASVTAFATGVTPASAEVTAIPASEEAVITETVEATPSASPIDESSSDVTDEDEVNEEENAGDGENGGDAIESPTPTSMPEDEDTEEGGNLEDAESTATPTVSPTESVLPETEATASPTVGMEVTPTVNPTASISPTPASSPAASISPTPTASVSPTPTTSASPSPSATPSATPGEMSMLSIRLAASYASAEISYFEPETSVDVSELSYTFKSETDANISSLNSSSTKYRLLMFAPVEDFRTADLWGDFYFYNMLLYETDYVDTIVLDTGRSAKARVSEIHQLETEFLKYVSGKDNSVYCYDTQTDDEQNQIWKAYTAFCNLCTGMEPAMQTESGEPCAGYFLIDENNQVVCYGYGQNYFSDVWEYIQDKPIVPPARPENIQITNMQGEVSFSWNVSSDITDVEAYVTFDDGSYFVDYSGTVEIENGLATYTIFTGATGEEENEIYEMKFRNLDGYRVKSDFSEVATNEGMECTQNPNNYKNVRLIDESGNAVEKLTLHQGETVKLRIQLEKNNGDKDVAGITDEVEWYMSSSDQEYNGYIYDDTPVKYWPGELADTSYLYLKGTEITEADYYLQCYFERTASTDSLGYDETIIIPVEVVAAEDGKTYPTQNPEVPIDLYTDKETVKETVYSNLQNKEEVFTIAVKDADWEAWDIEIQDLIFRNTDPSIPWIEQYIESYAGMVHSPTDSYTYRSVTVKDTSYRVYMFFAEYESGAKYFDYVDWVENKIEAVIHTPGGDLYQYKNADDYTKTKAVYDYVRKTISYVGTTDMTYHTVYGAWKNGKGTCDGYAQMMYRLLWEMGVSNCCMTDDFAINSTATHAYNIVELDGACYYLDASAGLFLKGKMSFGEHDYQSSYLEKCQEYVDKLSDDDYVYVPKSIQLSKTTDGITEKMDSFNAFNKAVEAIKEDGASADSYTLLLTGDMNLSDDSLNNSDISLNLNLNGHTLQVTADAISTADIQGGTDKAGLLKVANNVTFTVVPKEEKDTCIENVMFAYDGTNAQLVIGAQNSANKVEITGSSAGQAAGLKLQGNVELTGTMTAVTLTLSGAQASAENLAVTGDVYADPESKLRLSGTGSFKNFTLESGTESYIFVIDLLRSNDGKKNGTLKFSGTLANKTGNTKALKIDKYICNEEEQTLTEFASGEEIASVTSAATAFSESCILLEGKSTFAEREGNVLKAAKDTVMVCYYGEQVNVPSEKMYSSLEKAVAGLSTDFAKAKGNYSFVFMTDCVLSKDITIPAHVSVAMFYSAGTGTGETGYYELDLNGKTLTFGSESVTISEGIHIKNSVSGKTSQMKMSTQKSCLWIDTYGNKSYVDANGNTVNAGTDRYLFTNVNISAPNSQVNLEMPSGVVSENPEGLVYHIDGAIDANMLFVAGNTWETGNISAKYFYIENSISDMNNAPVSVETQVNCKAIKSDYIDNRGTLKAESLVLTNQTFCNEGKAEIKKIEKIANMDLREDSILVCDSINQTNGKTMYMTNASTLVVNDNATLQNVAMRMTDGAEGAYLYIKDGCKLFMQNIIAAEIAFNFGKLDTATRAYLDADGDLANSAGKIVKSENSYPIKALGAQSLLFSTANKAFPVEGITVMQQNADSTYVRAYQLGQNIYVGGEWITVKAMKADGTDTDAHTLKSFIKWTDASAYLSTLSNGSMTYIVEISEDVNTMETLVLPTQAAKVIFRGTGNGEDGRITFGYLGDIRLSTNVTFENINLNTMKYDKNSNAYLSDVKALNLNGKDLRLINSTAAFTAVSGNTDSDLYIDGIDSDEIVLSVSGAFAAVDLSVTDAKIQIDKTVTVTNAYLDNASVVAEGAVSVKETLSMESAAVDSKEKITLKNLITNDDKNKLIYGNNSNNILTISGEVSAQGSYAGNTEVSRVGNTWTIVDEEGTSLIRTAAVDISVRSLEGKYSQDVALVNATKAASSWFVVGSVYAEDGSRTGLAHLTHKDGNVVKCNGDAIYAVVLESYVGNDEEDGDFVYSGNFKTLQEAFNEIDRLANTQRSYMVTITDDSAGATDATKSLTFPSKAAEVIVAGRTNAADGKATLSYKGSLTLKSNVSLQNLTLNPTEDKAAVSLGNYGLTMLDCAVTDGKTIGKISGSGIAKTSFLYIDSPEFTEINGELNNVATLVMVSGDLTVKGKATVGEIQLYANTLEAEAAISVTNIINETGDGKVLAPATVTRNKDGDITKIVPQITVNGRIETTGQVTIGLTEKTKSGFEFIDFEEATESYLLNGIQLAKAQNASTDKVDCEGNNINSLSGVITKKGGYFVFYADADYGAKLVYQSEGETVTTYCLNFADAVAEINTLKKKQDYIIYLTESATDWNDPGSVKMPNTGMALTLTIAGEDDAIVDFYYTGGLTFASDIVVKNVNFLQMMKSDGVYVEASQADYPGIVKISSGGFAFTVDGEVFFNTPIALEGGNKGTFAIKDDGILISTYAGEINKIYGSVSKFANVEVGASGLTVAWYESKANTYTGGDLQVTNVTVRDEGYLAVQNNVTVTNTTIMGGEISVGGKGTFTNVTLSGSYAEIMVDKEFVISGTLTSTTDDAHLKTRKVLNKDAKKCIPYLNVKGNVVIGDADADKIYVGVYPNVADTSGVDVDAPVKLQDAPAVTAQLLTASKADAGCFRAQSENLLNVNEYSATDTDGYILAKEKESIFVYYASDVEVALCVGEVSDGELASAQVQNYYTSFKEAVAAVKAIKDKNAEYTILLLQNVGSATAPVSLELPGENAKLYIKSAKIPDAINEIKSIYYNNNITLKSATVFENVDFAPVKNGVGTQLSIAAGSYELHLKDVSVGNAADVNQTTSKMEIKDVTGKDALILDSANLQIAGIVKDFKNVTVLKNATVAGNLTVTKIELTGATLTGKKTVTVNDIANASGTLNYYKDASHVTNLTVKGNIENADANRPLILSLQLAESENRAAHELTLNGVKVELTKTKKLANIEKAPLSDFTIQIIKSGNTEAAVAENLVKAEKAVYLVNGTTDNNRVTMEMVGTTDSTVYLDLAQAMKDINALASKNAEYEISIAESAIADTDMTDTQAVSGFKLPDVGKAKKVTIESGENGGAVKQLAGQGAVSYKGDLVLRNLALSAESMTVNTLQLENTRLSTWKTSAVTNLVLTGSASWDALESTTIQNVDVSNATVEGEEAALSYLATKQDKNGKPLFTISKSVLGDNKAVLCKLIASDVTSASNIVYLSDYKDKSLVIAPLEVAEKFVAFPYRKLAAKAAGAETIEGISLGQWSAYKDRNNYVKNGNMSQMAVVITDESGLSTYAKSFEEAVTIIDNIKDMQAVYTMTLRDTQNGGANIIKTGKDGASYAELKLPSKAKAVTIKGESAENKPILMFTGEVKPACDVTFENVLLTDGKLSNNIFSESMSIALNMGNYSVTFGQGAGTEEYVSAGEMLLVCTKISGKKMLTVNGQMVTAKDTNVDVNELRLSDGAQVYAAKGIKVVNLYAEGDTMIRVETPSTMTFTNIIGDTQLEMHTYYTKNELAKAASQLTISGDIRETDTELVVKVVPYICRDANLGTYSQATAEDMTALTVTTAKPASFQELANMPKAAVENIEVYYDENGSDIKTTNKLYKYDKGLYLTAQAMAVHVYGVSATGDDVTVYQSEFRNWEDAVKEIDNRADKDMDYTIRLLSHVGITGDVLEPVNNLKFPSKAKSVTVKQAEGVDDGHIMVFTGNLSLGCDTTLEGICLAAVKKYTSGKEVYYLPVTYTMNVSNYNLTEKNAMESVAAWQYEGSRSNVLVRSMATLSGNAKGSYHCYYGNKEAVEALYAVSAFQIKGIGTVEFTNSFADANVVVFDVAYGITGVNEMTVNEGVVVDAYKGAVTANYVELAKEASLNAKDVTCNKTLTMSGSAIYSGTSAIGDGKVVLNNVILKDAGNILQGKQGKNGKSLIEIKGTMEVAAESSFTQQEAVTVILRYNDDSACAQLHEGMLIMTAQKVSPEWFTLAYSSQQQPMMGEYNINYGLLKTGKTIIYGENTASAAEVELIINPGTDLQQSTFFKTFEDAVKEIDTLALYKSGTKQYVDYVIKLRSNVEIGNEKQDGAYKTLNLASKVGQLTIDGQGYEIRFNGNISLKSNLLLKDVSVCPMKKVGKETVPAKANWALGKYTLTVENVKYADEAGNSLIGNVTGTSSSAVLNLAWSETATEESPYLFKAEQITGVKTIVLNPYVSLDVTKNLTAYEINFVTQIEADGQMLDIAKAQMCVGGKLVTTLINKYGIGEAMIVKPEAGSIEIKGAEIDTDGDKIKEQYAVCFGENLTEEQKKLTVELQGENHLVGTKILTCKYIDMQDYQVYAWEDSSYNEYEAYESGTSLMLGQYDM